MKNNSQVDTPVYTTSTTNKFSGLLPSQQASSSFFKHFIGTNKLFRWGMVLAVFVQFVIFKLLYPYPDFFSDSWSYIYTAYKGLNVNIWPIGYSKFLWLFHQVTHSAVGLVFFQFAMLELAGLYFYKTIVYFYPTSKTTRWILIIFLFFNPLHLYLSNYVSSDGPFVALSLLWITELIWIMQRPSFKHLIILTLTFLIAFTFRYNALYYPVIAAIAILLSRQKLWFKLIGISIGPILVIPIILFLANAVKEIGGKPQFPPILGGWQWANNALYIREYISEDTLHFPTPEMAELDQIARKYFRETPPHRRRLSSHVGNFFIQIWDAPLKRYMTVHYKDSGYASWAKVAPLFDEYGKYIVKRHPGAYFQHFMLMNSMNYFLPPLEKLQVYNLGMTTLPPSAIRWFDFREQNIKVVSYRLQGIVLVLLPLIFLGLNLYALYGIFLFIQKGGIKETSANFKKTIGLLTLFLLANFSFSIFANIIAFRYQVFPMIVCLAYVLLLTDYLEIKIINTGQQIRGETADTHDEIENESVILTPVK